MPLMPSLLILPALTIPSFLFHPNVSAAEIAKRNDGVECVVLLHGIARTSMSMRRLSTDLKSRGYKTVNYGYPSRDESIERLAETVVPEAVERCRQKGGARIHFVTHSLGGIVLRLYLQTHSIPGGGRVVMLAPPNSGSEVADYLEDFFLYRWFFGPAGQQLGTGKRSIPRGLKPVEAEVGIIAGDYSINPLFTGILPGPDDGVVSVEATRLKEMSDFIVVSSSHTFIMRNDVVMRQTAHFLEHGSFDHGD